MTISHPIIPREKLDFGLDGNIPRYWFGGDAFKSRYFDAMSTLFPEGERFFISCVRDFRDQVTDPQLTQDIKNFIRQEGQHGIVHTQYNERLKSQGIDVDRIENLLKTLFFKIARKVSPKAQTLAETAATEHLTAIMSEFIFTNVEVMQQADPRVRAMYAWHAIEEVEHKGVAYDVMIDYAKVSYFTRIAAMLHATIIFPYVILKFQNAMLKADGFSLWQRAKLNVKGIYWLLKPSGFVGPLYKPYFPYYKPGYHPWQEADQPGYNEWVAAFNLRRDPVEASELMRAAMAR
jgi:uncharacterized protein